jgi:hypothetical protein
MLILRGLLFFYLWYIVEKVYIILCYINQSIVYVKLNSNHTNKSKYCNHYQILEDS